MSLMSNEPRSTYVLVDGENIDATLGVSILQRRPSPEDRPRWERILTATQDRWGGVVKGVFFLVVHRDAVVPMPFVQALMAIGYRVVLLAEEVDVKVVDVAITRTLEAVRERAADVMLVSNDGDFVEGLRALLGTRRVGIAGFTEFRSGQLSSLVEAGAEVFDLEHDFGAFNARLPRIRVVTIDEFRPEDYL